MADIFISYSKADRFEVEKLAAMLEAEGWSVWWDKSLTAGDAYRDEIMKQLANARAVIAVWTPVSIKSDWVRAEAGRAKAKGKLIPVKCNSVGYSDIPLPFGEMHTEPLGNSEQICAAIVAQLAAAERPQAGLWNAIAGVRYAILSWLGILGGAITLYSSIASLSKLSDWAAVLVQNWREYSNGFWAVIADLIGIKLELVAVPLLTTTMFLTTAVLAACLGDREKGQRDGYWREVSKKTVLQVSITTGATAALLYLGLKWVASDHLLNYSIVVEKNGVQDNLTLFLSRLAVVFTAFSLPLAFTAMLFSTPPGYRQCICLVGCVVGILCLWPLSEYWRLTAEFTMAEIFLMVKGLPTNGNLLRAHIESLESIEWMAVVLCAFMFPIIAKLVPMKIVSRRLMFVLVGVGMLLMLNLISIGIHAGANVSPPAPSSRP